MPTLHVPHVPATDINPYTNDLNQDHNVGPWGLPMAPRFLWDLPLRIFQFCMRAFSPYGTMFPRAFRSCPQVALSYFPGLVPLSFPGLVPFSFLGLVPFSFPGPVPFSSTFYISCRNPSTWPHMLGAGMAGTTQQTQPAVVYTTQQTQPAVVYHVIIIIIIIM